MNTTKKKFIELALSCRVLQFGAFTLKSGRISPYFFNAGLFYDGSALRQLGQWYAEKLLETALPFDHLFGPAYKGLPLATTTAVALAEKGQNVTVTFNRKEIKDHGEGGSLIGAPLNGPTIMIDDVITAGTAFRESQALINRHGGQLVGVMIAFNRCERGLGDLSTLEEIEKEGIQVCSLISFFDLLDYLKQEKQDNHVKNLLAYHAKYGRPLKP